MDIKEVVKTAILRNSHEWGDEQAEAVLKAINEAGFLVVPAKAQAVPEGFVLVPKNPTHKMMEASWASLDAGSADEWWDVYEEVMKAAQEPAND